MFTFRVWYDTGWDDYDEFDNPIFRRSDLESYQSPKRFRSLKAAETAAKHVCRKILNQENEDDYDAAWNEDDDGIYVDGRDPEIREVEIYELTKSYKTIKIKTKTKKVEVKFKAVELAA